MAEGHPDFSDVIPDQDDEADWSEAAGSTLSLRIGAVVGVAVAVDDAWLSRLQAGYRIQGAPGRSVLRIVSEKPAPSLLSGGATAHRTAVGAVIAPCGS